MEAIKSIRTRKFLFDFIKVDMEPGMRRVSFADDKGNTQSFEDELHDMLKRHGYICEIAISALEVPETTALCKLTLEPRSEDAMGFTPIGGCDFEFTTDEREKAILQILFNKTTSIRI